MYRTQQDFVMDWNQASQGTLRVLRAMTDEALKQAIAEEHNTLGWLGWHITTSAAFFASLAGLEVNQPDGDKAIVPSHAADIANAYEKIAQDIVKLAQASLTDEMLTESVNAFGQSIPRGALLSKLIDHQTHHRGQMTVLLRQAGLPVPGVMGPTKEDILSRQG